MLNVLLLYNLEMYVLILWLYIRVFALRQNVINIKLSICNMHATIYEEMCHITKSN